MPRLLRKSCPSALLADFAVVDVSFVLRPTSTGNHPGPSGLPESSTPRTSPAKHVDPSGLAEASTSWAVAATIEPTLTLSDDEGMDPSVNDLSGLSAHVLDGSARAGSTGTISRDTALPHELPASLRSWRQQRHNGGIKDKPSSGCNIKIVFKRFKSLAGVPDCELSPPPLTVDNNKMLEVEAMFLNIDKTNMLPTNPPECLRDQHNTMLTLPLLFDKSAEHDVMGLPPSVLRLHAMAYILAPILREQKIKEHYKAPRYYSTTPYTDILIQADGQGYKYQWCKLWPESHEHHMKVYPTCNKLDRHMYVIRCYLLLVVDVHAHVGQSTRHGLTSSWK
jgi:hypothetical protein